MPQPSVNLSEELLKEFDQKLLEYQAAGELDRGTSRSEFIARLMAEWVETRDDVPPPL